MHYDWEAELSNWGFGMIVWGIRVWEGGKSGFVAMGRADWSFMPVFSTVF